MGSVTIPGGNKKAANPMDSLLENFTAPLNRYGTLSIAKPNYLRNFRMAAS
jgi:hypothetical protein